MSEDWDFNTEIENIDDEKKKYLGENQDALNLIINARKDKKRTVTLKIDGIPIEVYRNITREMEQKILDYRKAMDDLGEDYLPETLNEAKKPLFMILASLCAEKPRNEATFWELYDIQSNGDAANMLEDIYAGIKKMKKR